MPHFGLIPEDIPLQEELMLRAKLHVRGGRVRMERHNVADAIAAFYDAFVSAMQSRIIEYEQESADLDDERRIFDNLREKKIIRKFEAEDFRMLQQFLERAFNQSVTKEEFSTFSNRYETVMCELGALPINEDELPDEQAVTL